jgi:hypothetical protein
VYKNCWNKSNFFKASITKKKLSINTLDQAVIQFQTRITQLNNYRTISQLLKGLGSSNILKC